MNLKQLNSVCAIADNNLSITKAANLLHISQPGLSTQILLLEQELGLEIFRRDKKRLVSITAAGEIIINHARRVLTEIHYINEAARSHYHDEEGNFTVAASHTLSKRVLPAAIGLFVTRYPKVKLTTRSGGRKQITELLKSGEVDLGLTIDFEADDADLVSMPCHTVDRIVLAHSRHPILKLTKVTLHDLVQYPLLIPESVYFDGKVHSTFEQHGLTPNIAVHATNSDAIKSLVEQRLGISILTSLTYDKERDKEIKIINVNHLFGPSRSMIILNRKKFQHIYTFSFIEMLAPHLSKRVVENALTSSGSGNLVSE
jgi:LysR family cys regulon transcriptional activator